MAVKTKESVMGNYITKVNNYDIRMKVSYKPIERGTRNPKKEVGSQEFIVCRGRKVYARGLKTKDEAVAKANSLPNKRN